MTAATLEPAQTAAYPPEQYEAFLKAKAEMNGETVDDTRTLYEAAPDEAASDFEVWKAEQPVTEVDAPDTRSPAEQAVDTALAATADPKAERPSSATKSYSTRRSPLGSRSSARR